MHGSNAATTRCCCVRAHTHTNIHQRIHTRIHTRTHSTFKQQCTRSHKDHGLMTTHSHRQAALETAPCSKEAPSLAVGGGGDSFRCGVRCGVRQRSLALALLLVLALAPHLLFSPCCFRFLFFCSPTGKLTNATYLYCFCGPLLLCPKMMLKLSVFRCTGVSVLRTTLFVNFVRAYQ